MAFDPLTTGDLALLNRLIQTQPDLQDTISILRKVSANAKYPLADFDSLATALGGENATITFRGRTMTMAEARAAIPAYYFPITSESDLTAKVGDLEQALPKLPGTAPTGPTIKWGQERPKTAARTPPKIVAPAGAPSGRPNAVLVK